VYPMDYYSQAGGPWSNYHEETKDRKYEKEWNHHIRSMQTIEW
jgi:hypothetical protein